MLAPLYDDLESATMLAYWSREALSRIREKMMAQQKGEAFYDIGPPGSLEIPKFLKRNKNDPRDTTPMPKWIIEARAAAPKQTLGKNRPEPTALELQVLAAAEAEHEALTIGKRMAKKAMKEKDAEDKYTAKARRGKKPKEAAPDEPAPAVDHSNHYFDVDTGLWRPHGYMSRAKYQRLLAGMPTVAHRKVFIEMYGGTQKPEDRDVAQPAGKKKAPAPVKDTTKKAAAPAGATAGRERKLNPEHEAKVSAMLSRPEGATLDEIGAAMGWQKHSASAFLTGIRKTRAIVKTAEARGNVYRLESKS